MNGKLSNDISNNYTPKKKETRYFRVDRRLHNNTIFVIIEDENPKQPTYKIENFSRQFALKF